MLPEEPAGLIPTRTPGAVRFEATLNWKSGADAVLGDIIPSLSNPKLVKVLVSESDEIDGIRRVSGEVRAFSEEDIQGALDFILSTITSTAAISEAVLEVRCVRLARPHIVSEATLGRLARGLWEAGFRVRFGACWTPLCAGEEAAVGVRGVEDAREHIEDLGPWEVVSPAL